MSSSTPRTEEHAPPLRSLFRYVRDTPLFALLITAVVYLRCIDDAFVFDDEDMILRNRYLGDSAMLWKSFGRDFRWFMDPHHLPQSAYYRPLQDVWMSLNFHLFGLAVPGWHLGLIAIHLVAVWLVFLLARELIANRWAPVVAATLFGLMPVHAQAVVWASAMPLPTGAAFELAGLLCVMRGRRGWALIFCAFALMCHESAVMLPPILFAYAVILEPERDPSIPRETIRESMWRALAETWPFFVALTGYLLVRLMVFGFVVRSHSANPMTFVQLLTTLPSAIVTYVWLLVAPWSAGPDHQVEIVASMLSRDFVVPSAIVIAIAIAAVAALRSATHRRLYLFCLVWMVIAMAPVLNLREFPPLVMVQDRYLYLSSAAWCLILVDAAFALSTWMPVGAGAIVTGGAILAALYGIILFHAETFWRDDVALFTTCLHMFPDSWECHAELGTALMDEKDFDGAEEEFRAALEINPNFPGALVNLATIDERTGRTAEALGDIKRALVLMPQWVHTPAPYISLARNLDSVGAVDLRESALKDAASLPGGETAVERMRGEMAIGHQDYTAAELDLRAAAAGDPADPETWALLAAALEREGKIPDAISAGRKALALKPDPDLAAGVQKLLDRLGAS